MIAAIIGEAFIETSKVVFNLDHEHIAKMAIAFDETAFNVVMTATCSGTRKCSKVGRAQLEFKRDRDGVHYATELNLRSLLCGACCQTSFAPETAVNDVLAAAIPGAMNPNFLLPKGILDLVTGYLMGRIVRVYKISRFLKGIEQKQPSHETAIEYLGNLTFAPPVKFLERDTLQDEIIHAIARTPGTDWHAQIRMTEKFKMPDSAMASSVLRAFGYEPSDTQHDHGSRQAGELLEWANDRERRNGSGITITKCCPTPAITTDDDRGFHFAHVAEQKFAYRHAGSQAPGFEYNNFLLVAFQGTACCLRYCAR